MIESLELFLTFLRAALLSVGGISALPMLRQDLVTAGLVTEREVLESITIGRLSPGPGGLFFVSLGYFAAGLLGAALALTAISVPALGIVAAAGFVRRQLRLGWAAGFIRGVVLSTSGLVVATGIALLAADRPIVSVPAWQIVLATIATGITIRGGVHPAPLVLGGALVGLALGR